MRTTLNNGATGARSRSGARRISRTPAWFGIAVALLLAGVNGGITRAQNLGGASAPGGNRVSAQQSVRKRQKTGRTAATQPAQNLAKKPDSKSTPKDSKDQESETPFGSLANSKRGPISIQSDSLALDYKQNAVLFDGHVRATQADAVLASNRLKVKYGKDFHEVQDMAADGNVRISQGVRWCTSDRAVMDQRQHTVILTGSPICHDASDQIAGTRITVHLDTGKSDVQAAKAVIFPQQSKTRDNEALADQMK